RFEAAQVVGHLEQPDREVGIEDHRYLLGDEILVLVQHIQVVGGDRALDQLVGRRVVVVAEVAAGVGLEQDLAGGLVVDAAAGPGRRTPPVWCWCPSRCPPTTSGPGRCRTAAATPGPAAAATPAR